MGDALVFFVLFEESLLNNELNPSGIPALGSKVSGTGVVEFLEPGAGCCIMFSVVSEGDSEFLLIDPGVGCVWASSGNLSSGNC